MTAVSDNFPPAQPVVEPLDPRKLRRIVWTALLVLAGFQAWSSRFYMTPDGMSYLDMSDGIVTGKLGLLVNGYWSPLYPALIGVARLLTRTGPYWEFAVVHLLNVLLFAASIAGFEYFLDAFARVATTLGRHGLGPTSGRVIAYAIFGVLSLAMTPLELPTPDLIVTTASFVVFGALLRVKSNPEDRRAALTLGLALGIGALAKSFFVPWALVVLPCAWLGTRRAGSGPVIRALVAWILIVAPWAAIVSGHVGRLTFGDTGRLTYIWNVNRLEPPSLKVMPHGATLPTVEPILANVAITPGAQGTNPVWFDPTRWYTGLSPRWDPEHQIQLFSGLVTYFITSLAPIVVILWCAFVFASHVERRAWATALWIIVLPALAAIGAYSLVLVATRYIAPFVVTLTIATVYGLRWPSRITPARVGVGIGVPLLVMVSRLESSQSLIWTNAMLGAVLVAWAFRRRGAPAMIVAAVVGVLAIRILQPSDLTSIPVVAAVLVFVSYWLSSARAFRNGEPRFYAQVLRNGLFAASIVLMLVAAGIKYYVSIQPPQSFAGESNAAWLQTRMARKAGLRVGDKIAVIGSPFEAYWARTAGLQIVGVVPPWRVAPYQELTAEKRAMIEREFARAGAKAIVAQVKQPPTADSGWKAYEYIGWIKALPRP